MSIALQDHVRPATAAPVVLTFNADLSWAGQHRHAWQDVTDGLRLWRLAFTLGWLDIRLRYRGSMLGPFWLTLSTAVMVGSLGLLYATLFHMNLHEYLPFLALSLVLWGYVSALVGEAGTCFTQAEGIIRSVRMPFFVQAIRTFWRNLLVLGAQRRRHRRRLCDLPNGRAGTDCYALPGLVLWVVDALAICLLLGAFCARFRDIPPIVASVMQIAFFMTPIIWRAEPGRPACLDPAAQSVLLAARGRAPPAAGRGADAVGLALRPGL